AATREPGQITLRELETGRALHTLPMRLPDGQPGYFWAFSANGRFLAACAGQEAWVWETSTGRQVGYLNGLDATIRGIRPSPDGKRLAVGIEIGAKPIDAKKADVQRVQKVEVRPVVPGQAEQRVAKHQVEVWDLSSGRRLMTFPRARIYRGFLAFSPDSTRLATHVDDEYEVWELASGRRLLTGKLPAMKESNQAISWITFSSDGKQLALACADRTVRVHDADDNREIFVLKGHRIKVGVLAYSLDNRRLASSDFQGKIKLWDTTTGQELLALDRDDPTVAWNPEVRRMMALSDQLLPFGVADALPANDPRAGQPKR
ncbi:MAG: hypothetical protein L0215_11200, partial [Gemmataceae bacterium]|nr:hypothetical protein [Gemmataceae bacterium]